MTDDAMRWAEALAVERLHGSDARRWVAERIGAMAMAGDDAGIERFRQIASRLDRLVTREARGAS